MNNFKSILRCFFIFFLVLNFTGCNTTESIMFEITYDSSLGLEGYNGRLLLMITKDTLKEPRFQINDSNETGIIIGKNVQQWIPGQKESFNSSVKAYPIEELNQLKSGTYFVQALLHKYETFNLSNGYSVQLPMDQGEGQHWNTSPKNIYSKPIKIEFDISSKRPIEIVITEEIPSIKPVEDSKYIKPVSYTHLTLPTILLV